MERKLNKPGNGGGRLRGFDVAPELQDDAPTVAPEGAAPWRSNIDADTSTDADAPSLTPLVTEEKKTHGIPREEAVQLHEQGLTAEREKQEKIMLESNIDPGFFVTAATGSLVANPALSILNKDTWKKKSGEKDKISDALQHLSDLQPGEKALIIGTIRALPYLSGITQNTINQIKFTGAIQEHKKEVRALVWARKAKKSLEKLQRYIADKSEQEIKPLPRHALDEKTVEALRLAEMKVRDNPHFETNFRVILTGRKERAAELTAMRDDVGTAISSSYIGTMNSQKFGFVDAKPLDALLNYMPIQQDEQTILSKTELAQLMSIPDGDTHAGHSVSIPHAKIKWLPMRQPTIVADIYNPPAGVIPFGLINEGSDHEANIGMPIDDLKTHMYFCGATGTGKSNLMQWLAWGLIKSGESIVMVDPHGSLIDQTLRNIITHAPERIDDVLIIDFGDPNSFVAFNPIDIQNKDQIEPTVTSIMETFLAKNNLNLLEAPRARPLLQAVLWALCEANVELSNHSSGGVRNTLLEITTFLADDDFRHLIMDCCTNEGVKQRFGESGHYDQLSAKNRVEQTSPITSRFEEIKVVESFSNVFGQSQNKLNYFDFIKENKIILLKFPKYGGANHKVVNFISGLTMPLLLMLMGRLNQAGKRVYLLVDEFQNYASDSYRTILEEARKFGLHTIATSQNPGRLDKEIQDAVYSNARSKITLQLDKLNVGRMADSISGDSTALKKENVVALPNYYGYGNLMQDSGPSGPFTFKALGPMSEHLAGEELARVEAQIEQIQTTSNMRLSTSVDQVRKHNEERVDTIMTILGERLRSHARDADWKNQPRVAGMGEIPEEAFDVEDDFDW